MAVGSNNPQFLLFAQHGWADTGNCLGRFAKAAANPETIIIAPSLGLIKTFIRIEPLIKQNSLLNFTWFSCRWFKHS